MFLVLTGRILQGKTSLQIKLIIFLIYLISSARHNFPRWLGPCVFRTVASEDFAIALWRYRWYPSS